MKSYVIIIVDDKALWWKNVEAENIRIDFVRIGEVVHGRRFHDQRINVVINRSKYRNLDEVTDEGVARWWAHVKNGLDKNVEIRDGVNK